MAAITTEQVKAYIEKEIPGFHRARLDSLRKLSLKKVLQRKNPYLYKAKNINLAADLVRGLLDAHLSSQEEGIFGNFLEGLSQVCEISGLQHRDVRIHVSRGISNHNIGTPRVLSQSN